MKNTGNYGIQTKAIHAGEEPDPITRASSPNLVMSSTYVVDEPLSFSANNMKEDIPFLYTRWGNPTVRQLEQKLAALEGAEACVAFASGMAATSALLFSALSHGDHLIISDINYAGTAEFVRETLPRMGIEVSQVDTSCSENIANALRKETRLVWVETPCNPIVRLTDIRKVADIVHDAGARLAVDSTFASPIATRPIELGADYVIHSLTKYIGGHGDALGGAVLGQRDAMSALNREAVIHYGGALSPFNAWLIMRGAATLPLRMQAHAYNAHEVAAFLEVHPKARRVIYPGLTSHPQHLLAKRQMQNYSGMLTLQVEDGANVAARMMKQLSVIHYAVSLGHHRSLIYWMSTKDLVESSFQLTAQQLESYRAYAGDGVFRISVGLEDPHDLCAELAQVLN